MFHFGSFLFGANVGAIVIMVVGIIIVDVKKKIAAKKEREVKEDEV